MRIKTSEIYGIEVGFVGEGGLDVAVEVDGEEAAGIIWAKRYLSAIFLVEVNQFGFTVFGLPFPAAGEEVVVFVYRTIIHVFVSIKFDRYHAMIVEFRLHFEVLVGVETVFGANPERDVRFPASCLPLFHQWFTLKLVLQVSVYL